MWNSKSSHTKKGKCGLVSVAVDKDKTSQYALKWAIDNLLSKGQPLVLIHVFNKASSFSTSLGISNDINKMTKTQLENSAKDLFLSFHCYCTRKDIPCIDVVLHDNDVAKAIAEYATRAAIENIVIGVSTHHGFMRKFKADTPGILSRGAPDFCNVYVISKSKVSSFRSASRRASFASPLLDQIDKLSNHSDSFSDACSLESKSMRERALIKPRVSVDEIKSPLGKVYKGQYTKQWSDFSDSETDISFISSRPSSDRASSIALDYYEHGLTPRGSSASRTSVGSNRSGPRLSEFSHQDFSFVSQDSSRTSISKSSQGMHEDIHSEVRKLKLELKHTIDMYSTACREALNAKQQAMELSRLRISEEHKIEEAKSSEEAALVRVEREKERFKAAIEDAEAAKKIAEMESHKRVSVEAKAMKDIEEMKRIMANISQNDIRYRRYSIDQIEEATEKFNESRKIGEGGYGPVYKCYLDHTPVAVKLLRPDAAQGKEQFQREVEILSLIRHPNMVLLLGACPEYGILVYEYMANGSLEDRLFRRGNSPSLPWQLRFKIAAEIATGLLFLHQTKPEPLVHRDLKPGNILLDINYVSKISDVGLARLVPAVADNVTQCRMTSAAGTFCYIDPEYQQTGMLGVKSDVYSLGIILLQLLTGKPPMALTHHVCRAIEGGKFSEVLDPTVSDWPENEALCLAKIAIHCSELRRKDRPDLATEVLPELNRLREMADDSAGQAALVGSSEPSPNPSVASSFSQEMLSDVSR